jgi:chromosome segregation ATPase
LNREIGKKETEIEMKEGQLIHLQRNLEELNGIENQNFLLESMNNLNENRKQAEARITLVENTKLSSKQLEQKIDRLHAESVRLKSQIDNYDHQLIHSISGKQDTKELLNFIFSSEFSSLSSDLVKKKVSKTGDTLKIFDGEIEIPADLPVREIPSIDALKQTLKEIEADLHEQEKLLAVSLDFEKARRDLDGINADLDIVKLKINKLKEKPALESTVGELSKEVRALKNQREKLEEELEKLKEEITSKSIYLDTVREDARRLEERIDELKAKKAEIEMLGITPTEFETNDNLEEIYEKIRVANHDRESLKVGKDRTFDQLRFKTNSAIADETEFVKYIEEEIACIADKEKSIDGLLQSISTQFANPAHNLRRRFDEFKEYVYHSFNESLAKTRISNIESLRIELVENKRVMHDLERIASIQNMTSQLAFEFDKAEDLEILNKYLDQSKKVVFEDLFDIELHLNLRGHIKKVDLKEQVESDGTDRMIRLVIIMAIINRMAISSEANRTVLFIDEIGTIDEQNRPELVNFCREHHFLPIFAAPQAYDGFSKYYFIFRSKGKINLNDDQHSVKRTAIA